MVLTLQTAAATPTLDTATIKAHLKVDGSDEDALIAALAAAWDSHVDGKNGVLGRALLTQSWILTLDEFPACDGGAIRIPLPPLQSVDSISYVDAAGDTQTLSESDYFLDSASEPARLMPAYGKEWPQTLARANAVEISFTAGFGDDADDVPQAIRHAGLVTIGHWYENRMAVSDKPLSEVPMTAEFLISPFRIYGF